MFDFEYLKNQYFYFLKMYKSGSISQEEFGDEVEKLTGCDENGTYWAISEEGYWLWYDGEKWVQSEKIYEEDIEKNIKEEPKENFESISFPKLVLLIIKKFPGAFIKKLPSMIIPIIMGVIIHTYLTVFKNEGFNDNYNFVSSLLNLKGLHLNSAVLWGAMGLIFSETIKGIKSNSFFSSIPRFAGVIFKVVPQILKDKKNIAVLFITIGISLLIGKSFRPITGILLTVIGIGAISKLFKAKEKTGSQNPTISAVMRSGGSTLYMFSAIAVSDISKWLKSKGKKRLNFNIDGFSKYIITITGSLTLVTLFMSYFKLNRPYVKLNIYLSLVFLVIGIFLLFKMGNLKKSSAKNFIILFFSYCFYKASNIMVSADDGGWQEAGGTFKGWINSPGATGAVTSSFIPVAGVIIGLTIDQIIKNLLQSLIPQLENDPWWESKWKDQEDSPEEEKEEEKVEGFNMLTDVNPSSLLADGKQSLWVYGMVVSDDPKNNSTAEAATENITFSKGGGYSESLTPTGNTGMTGGYMAAEYIAATPMDVKETFGSAYIIAKAPVNKGVVTGTQVVSLEFVPGDLSLGFGCEETDIMYDSQETITLSAAVSSSNPDFDLEKIKEFNRKIEFKAGSLLKISDVEWTDDYAVCEVHLSKDESLEYLPETVEVTAEVLIEGKILTGTYTFNVIAKPDLTLDKKEVSFMAGSQDEIVVTGTLINGGKIENWDEPDFKIEYSEDIFTYDYKIEKNKIIITIRDSSDLEDSKFEGNGKDYAKLTLHMYNPTYEYDLYAPISILALKEGLYITNHSSSNQKSNEIIVTARENEETKRITAEVLIWDSSKRALVTDRSALDSIDFKLGDEESILYQNIFEVTNLRCELSEKDPSTAKALYEINVDHVFHMSKDFIDIPLIFTASSERQEYEKNITIKFKSSAKEYEEYSLMEEVKKCHEVIDKLFEKGSSNNSKYHSFVDEWSKSLSSNGLNYMRRHYILERAVEYNETLAKGYMNQSYYLEMAENVASVIDFVGNIAFNVVITVLSGPVGPAVMLIRTMGGDILKEQLILAINCWQEGKSYDTWADEAWERFSFMGMGTEITFEALQNAPNAKLKVIGYIGQIIYAIKMVYDGSLDSDGNLSLKALATNLLKVFTSIALTNAALKMTASKMTQINGNKTKQGDIESDQVLKNINSTDAAKVKSAKEYLENMFKNKDLIDIDGNPTMRTSDAVDIMRNAQAVRTLKNIDLYPPEIQKLLKDRAKAFGERIKQINDDVDTEVLNRIKEKFPEDEFKVDDFRTPGSDPNKINTDRDVRILHKNLKGEWVELDPARWKGDYNEIKARNTGLNSSSNPHEIVNMSKERWDKLSQIEKEELWSKSLRQEATSVRHDQACIDYSDQANTISKDGKLEKVKRPNIQDVIEGKAKLKDPEGVGKMFENKIKGEYSDTNFGKSEAVKQAQKGIEELEQIRDGYAKGGHSLPELDPEFKNMVNEIKDLPTDYKAGFDNGASLKYGKIDEAKINNMADLLKKQFQQLTSNMELKK